METKKLTLVSLEPNNYPNIDIDCRVVDDMKEYVEKLVEFQATKGVFPQKAKKTASMKARVGIVGEEVDTRPRVKRGGRTYVIGETRGKVKVEGSMIVTNPDDEEYIVKPEVFPKKYASTSKPGIYLPIAEPIKYITLTKDIVFKAPWGEDMFGLKGAAINISDLNDIYAIQNVAFKKTYTPV